ncbi:MAG: M23 family metallopeptidase [Bacillota bacterium]
MTKKKFHCLSILLIAFLIILSFNFQLKAADIEIILSDLEVKQGEIFKITLKSNSLDLKAENFSAQFADKNFKFYKNNDTLSTIIAVSYWTKTGINNLSIKENDKYIYHKNIKVNKTNFPESWIRVDENKEKLVRPEKEDKELKERLARDNQKVAEARSNSKNEKLFDGNFIWPLEGIITTEFGATRYVNGSLQSRHSGIDIAADTGTTIMASNSGIVTLASDLTVTGKTVIVDHGQGIFSTYAHLSKANVKKGDKINKGDKIGEIGSTGFSTGPHLHWTIKINNIFINPRVLLN